MKKINISKKYIIGIVLVVLLVGGVFLGGKAVAWNKVKTNSIGLENAQNYALADSGIDPKKAQILKTKFDHEDGEFIYEVEFIYENVKYKYDIKAVDGIVLKKSLENINNKQSNTTIVSNISAEKARDIALNDLGFLLENVEIVKMNLESEDNIPVYEIKFITNNKEYQYEINATNGNIYAKDIKTLNSGNISNNQDTNGVNTNNNQNISNISKEITIDKAKEIALKDAKLNTATFTKTKTDYDDGVKVYEMEFYSNNTEYEYEINAVTGAILDKEIERD